SLGMDFQGRSITAERNGSVNLPPREGDKVVFGQPPGADTNFDHWDVTLATIAPFAVAEIVIGKLTLTPGLRFEPTLADGGQSRPPGDTPTPIGYSHLALPSNPTSISALRWAPNPRLVATLHATKRLTLTIGG